MDILKKFWEKAAKLNGTIVLPEAYDLRTLEATQEILAGKLAKVILVGNSEEVKNLAKENNFNIDGADIYNPNDCPHLEKFANYFYEKRKHKGVTLEKAYEIIKQPLFFGALLVKFEIANGMVAGAANTTGDVLRAALQVVGVRAGLKTVSSCFIMVTPHFEGDEGVFLFGDCAVVPNPTSEQLVDIACSTAETRKKLIGDEPKVALLSFSTKGSAKHELVDKVVEAKQMLEAKNVDFDFDGELQLDAAVIGSVGSKKAPGSKIAGKANVLVFPDLQAGNIGYKLVQRFGNAQAIGPVIQGLAAPICDLSRGCSAKDISNTAALVLLISQK